jgi:RNA polymerase sigma factor (sigma-70 family)
MCAANEVADPVIQEMARVFTPLHRVIAKARVDARAFEEVWESIAPMAAEIVAADAPLDGDVDGAVHTLRLHLHHVIERMPASCSNARAYIRAALRRQHARVQRAAAASQESHSASFLADLVDAGDAPDVLVLRGEREELLRRGMRKLPVALRQILTARYAEGLTQGDTAKRLGVTERTVRRRESYAVRALRRLVGVES